MLLTVLYIYKVSAHRAPLSNMSRWHTTTSEGELGFLVDCLHPRVTAPELRAVDGV